MAKTPNKEIEKIEKTQEALRESIEQAKGLAEEAQKLLSKHKKSLKNQSS
jgi:ABC-type transporter Mla subunit MlaD